MLRSFKRSYLTAHEVAKISNNKCKELPPIVTHFREGIDNSILKSCEKYNDQYRYFFPAESGTVLRTELIKSLEKDRFKITGEKWKLPEDSDSINISWKDEDINRGDIYNYIVGFSVCGMMIFGMLANW